VASVVVILTVVAVLWRRPSPGGEGAPAVPRRQPGSGRAVAVGALSVTATLLYFFATHSGCLTIAAVLTSLYPGVTVLLATLLLGERISPLQRAGLALCAVAVTAIVVG
jgi:drug/metabolite transporter (DMT)-like permease